MIVATKAMVPDDDDDADDDDDVIHCTLPCKTRS